MDRMEYCGKSLDEFEYAFSSLLRANGADPDPLPSLDCLSFRSFAFSGGGAVKDWFRPAAEWRFYLPALAGNLGCADALEVWDARDVTPDAFQTWTLVGEAAYPGRRVSARSKFYSGTPPFFLCRGVPGTKEIMICDPAGVPCDLAEESGLCAGLRRSNGFLAGFREPPAIRVAPAETVLDRALAWRGACRQDIAAEEFLFAERYHGGVREQISLRYGLMNWHVQTDKTIRFFSDAGLLRTSVRGRLARMLSDLPDVWENGRFELLRRVDETLWNALEKAR